MRNSDQSSVIIEDRQVTTKRRQTNAAAGRDDNRIGETGNQGLHSVICHYRSPFRSLQQSFSRIFILENYRNL